MIILITGATHTGKTNLAQKLLEKYKIPYLSIDHLKMGLIRSGQTELTPEDDDLLTDYLWNIVKEIIKTAVENKQQLIVEGCYIPFDWKKDFDGEYLRGIRYICLCMTDSYIEKHSGDILRFASCIESRMDDGYLTLDLVKRDNKMFRDGCEKNGLEYVLIDEDYSGTISRVLRDII